MKQAFCSLVFTLILGLGCSSILTSSSAPPAYYQIQYAPSSVGCSKTFGRSVRVWDFSNSSPYNRNEMVVLEGERQVLYSNADQWIAKPGTMIGQSLIRDLDSSPLFPHAVGPDSPVFAPLELSGRVLVFCWQKKGAEFKAVFQVEVILTEARGSAKILFKQNYKYESKPFEKNDPSEFALAMSGLINDFSKNLRRDLCSTLTEPFGKQ
jgi:ABC-type uncharacterized transport system auxiliary subunit